MNKVNQEDDEDSCYYQDIISELEYNAGDVKVKINGSLRSLQSAELIIHLDKYNYYISKQDVDFSDGTYCTTYSLLSKVR